MSYTDKDCFDPVDSCKMNMNSIKYEENEELSPLKKSDIFIHRDYHYQSKFLIFSKF